MNAMRTRTILLCLAATLVAGTAMPAGAAFEGSGPKILSSAEKAGSNFYTLRSVHPKTGATKLLVDVGEGWVTPGAYSADGRRIVYFARENLLGSDNEIFVARSDGSNAHAITNNITNDWTPHFSPSGQQIVYATNTGISVMDDDGTNSDEIVTDSPAVQPVWSPNGNWIVYSRINGDNWDVWRVRPNGDDNQAVTDSGSDELMADISPDGKFVIFQADNASDYEVHRSKLDGTGEKSLVAVDGIDLTNPMYSSNGERVLFNRYEGGHEIWSANAATGKQRKELVANGRTTLRTNLDGPRARPSGEVACQEIPKWGLTGPIVLTLEPPTGTRLARSSSQSVKAIWSPFGENGAK